MYLHIGQDFVLNENDIIGVFDFDHLSTSKISMEYLKGLEKIDSLISISSDLPKSVIITIISGQHIGYLSPLNSKTIEQRNKTKII